MVQASLRFFVFLLLLLLTVLSCWFFERYQDAGPELLVNHDFTDGLVGWTVRGAAEQVFLPGDASVGLAASKREESVRISQEFVLGAKEFQLVRLKGRLRVEGVQPGEKPWHMGRLLLASYDQDGKWLPVPHQVVALEGTQGWQEYEEVFTISPEAQKICVVVQLARCSGTLLAQGLSLREVEEAAWYPGLKWTVLGLWTIFLFWIFSSSLDAGRIGKPGGILTLVTFVVILIGIAIPGDLKHELQESVAGQLARSDSVKDSIREIVQEDQALYFSWLSPSRMIHFFLFSAFGLLLASFSPKGSRHLILHILMLAVATEMMQFYVEGRTPQFGDGVADFLGGAFAFLVVRHLRGKGGKKFAVGSVQ